MQYRCYACGIKLGKGIPPLEALSQAQADVVGNKNEDAPQRFNVLDGTKFEGMSTYSFCAFCLLLIQDTPDAFYVDTKPFYDEVTREYYSWHPDDERRFAFDWVKANRLIHLLRAKSIYKNHDFSTLESLLEEGA